jgi:hypothetical protein
VYGLEATRFGEFGSSTTVLPRLGFAFDMTPRTRLFGGMVPGSSDDIQTTTNAESGEILFTEAKPVAMSGAGEPVPDRSYRLQLGGEQILGENSTLEFMAFLDTVSGHGVGLLAIPADSVEPTLQTREFSARSRGMRVVYHRRLNSIVEGAIGYAFGEGQQLSGAGLDNPARLFERGVFHIVSARLDARFVETGTRVSTVVRLAPERAVLAIDPFQGQINTFDPNINVYLAQELPDFGLLPGQLALVVDLRNLLDQQASITDEKQELVASRFNRLVRIGVSLRF